VDWVKIFSTNEYPTWQPVGVQRNGAGSALTDVVQGRPAGAFLQANEL